MMPHKPLLLVIEDDPTSLRLITAILSAQYDLVIAMTGQDGLQQLQQKPDLIMVDIGLPDMSGIEVIHRIKANDEYVNTPIIVSSADRNEITIEKAFAEGAIDYSLKPHIGELLLARVRIQLDIIEKNKLLREAAMQDGLTGLANRRHYDNRLLDEWSRLAREKKPFGMVLLDIDNFKKINDHYGHLTGDKCLQLLSALLAKLVRRPGDIACRYGGEEFVILLPNTDLAGTGVVASLVCKTVEDAFIREADLPDVTVSIGFAVKYPGSDEVASLFFDADEQLYIAKRSGKNCVRPDSF